MIHPAESGMFIDIDVGGFREDSMRIASDMTQAAPRRPKFSQPRVSAALLSRYAPEGDPRTEKKSAPPSFARQGLEKKRRGSRKHFIYNVAP